MSRRQVLRGAALLAALAAFVPASAPVAAAGSTELLVTGMTFVGSRGSVSELVLRAERAVFHPERDLAELEVVHASVASEDDGESFEMTCDRIDLNVETNDFFARGRVRGVTGDGQRYTAPWVKYDHASDLLYTDAPVTMVDGTGSFRGDGFRYNIAARSFKLLGNVTVVQGP